jgi:hypothetical protein
VLFVESVPVPPEHEKYVTHRYHKTQKHMFGARYPDAFLWNP